MAKTESDRKNEKDTSKRKVTPLGTDKKKRKNPDDEPQEEFIDSKPNKSKPKKCHVGFAN
jgi:hypothetical protein